MDEMRVNMKDLDGEEIYLDAPLTQEDVNALLEDTIQETVEVTRQTLKKIGLMEKDVGQMVFIGGPTKYAPLRQRVLAELGIPAGATVDQMTAVAEGASIYAESVDWGDAQHYRKKSREEMSAAQNLVIRYEKRTAADAAKIAFVAKGELDVTLEVVCEQTGWSSGRIDVKKSIVLTLPIAVSGENSFRVQLWDAAGRQLELKQPRIVITKTMAVIGTIPASNPIAVKALDRVGGKAVPIYLVDENDPLPKRGRISLMAGKTIHAGSEDALVFTLWEGGIKDPIEDNRYIGTYRISGTALPEGTVSAGTEIICDYEMSDSGALRLGVSIPAIGASLHEMNYYSRQEGQTALDDQPRMLRQVASLEQRLSLIQGRLPDAQELSAMSQKVADIRDVAEHSEDPESLLKANNDLLECLRALSRIREAHRRDIRLLDLDQVTERFEIFKSSATESEIAAFRSCREAALRAVDKETGAFEVNMAELETRVSALLWRSDAIILLNVKSRLDHPDRFTDRAKFDRLRAAALTAERNNNINELRRILSELISIEKPDSVQGAEQMMEQVNVIRK